MISVSSNTTQPSSPATTSTSVTVPQSLSQANNSSNKIITSTVSASNSSLSSNHTMSTTKASHVGVPGVPSITASSNKSISSTSRDSSGGNTLNSLTTTTSKTNTVSSISSGRGKAPGPPISTASSSSASTTASTAALSVMNGDNKPPDPSPLSNSTIVPASTTQTSRMVSVTSSIHTSDSPIRNVSKVTSVVTDTSQRTTSTSTITDQPESTFSSAEPVTVVDPSGKSSLSFPPLITVFSTTSESNGSVVTFTHVIANPTGLIGSKEAQTSTFLNNGGKVAGVFVVVGILAASIVLFACLTIRRRRNQARRRKRWLANLQRPLPLPPDPFEDPQEPRSMIQVENSSWANHGNVTNNSGHTYLENGLALTGTGPIEADERSNEIYTIQHAISASRRSFAQSSPSLYPPSLPPDDAKLDEGVQLTFKRSQHKVAPPRPPRSPFREGPTRYAYPITPPPSASSDENDLPPSPESYKPSPSAFFTGSNVRSRTSQDDILARPTLLDIRHRTTASP